MRENLRKMQRASADALRKPRGRWPSLEPAPLESFRAKRLDKSSPRPQHLRDRTGRSLIGCARALEARQARKRIMTDQRRESDHRPDERALQELVAQSGTGAREPNGAIPGQTSHDFKLPSNLAPGGSLTRIRAPIGRLR